MCLFIYFLYWFERYYYSIDSTTFVITRNNIIGTKMMPPDIEDSEKTLVNAKHGQKNKQELNSLGSG